MSNHRELPIVAVELLIWAPGVDHAPLLLMQQSARGMQLPGVVLAPHEDLFRAAAALARTVLGRPADIGPELHRYEVPTWDALGERPAAVGIACIVSVSMTQAGDPPPAYQWLAWHLALLQVGSPEAREAICQLARS